MSARECRVVDASTGGEKGVKPEAYALIPDEALDELARVYGFGAEKYAPYNWLRGYAWSLSVSALKRHLSQWCQGIDRDEETGCHHLIHAAWHCLTLFVFQRRGLGTDDRMPPFKGELK